MTNLLVTATPPTPNGELHLGHLSGPYLAGDVYRRHQARSAGTLVAYVSGIDDHQSYTEARAVRDGRTAAQVADHYGGLIERAWSDTAIGFDLLGHPRRSGRHAELTREVFTALHKHGDIVARTRPLPYCSTCDRWAYEAYVTGACPHCGTASCGNSCEVCGLPNDCADLADAHCTICGDPCELRNCERLYLQLEPQRKTLELFWGQVRMGGHLRALCHRIAEGTLPEIAVSHPADWGLTVPVPGFTEQRIYVWFEMATGYLAAAQELDSLRPGTDAWRGGGRTVQFFGYDNGWFHAVLFPAIMKAYDPALTLPAAFVSNEFYRLDGLKFSTSRQHAIWLLDALRDIPADHLRIHLCWNRPSAAQTSFTWPQFTTFLREDLLARWYRWLSDLGRRRAAAASRPGDADLACQRLPLAPSAAVLEERCAEMLRRIDAAYCAEDFSPRRALQLLDQLVRDAAELGDHHEHLRGLAGLHGEFVAAVRAELAAATALAAGLYPIAPVMAQQLWSALGHSGAVADHDWRQALATPLTAGELAAGCPLFDPAGVAQKGE